MKLTDSEIDLMREWFDSVQDVNPAYLTSEDYVLAVRLYEHLGMRVPHSLLNKPEPPK